MDETEANEQVTIAVNAMIERALTLTTDEIAFSVMLSRISRELRRSYGVAGAQSFLFDFVGSLSSRQSEGEVVIPSADYRMGVDERAIWLMMHVIIQHARRMLAEDQMFTIMLRGIASKMGDAARPILLGVAETMAEAAQRDA